MNRSPALEVQGNLLQFIVVLISADDNGHGGGNRTVIYRGYDILEAFEKAREKHDWSYTHIEVEGWR